MVARAGPPRVPCATAGRRVGAACEPDRATARPSSPRRQDERVAVGVAELGEGAPGLPGRTFDELDAALRQLPVRRLDVVALQRAVEERADAILVAGRGEQHQARGRIADAQLDPALP